jgi:hypothetical protein
MLRPYTQFKIIGVYQNIDVRPRAEGAVTTEMFKLTEG